MFDPLGWLAPVVFSFKHFMQRLWQHGLGWDDELTPELQKQWMHLTAEICTLSNLRIDRHVPTTDAVEIKLLGFCYASEKGYACNIYVRCLHAQQITVELIAAKTKVAPLKPLSTPRLELNAALLLIHLHNAMKSFIGRLPTHETWFFSDSEIALGWLHTPPHRLKTYVANRVVEITEKISPGVWRHIASKHNPSDCASRGLTAPHLINRELWWHGPKAARQPEFRMHHYPSKSTSESELPELKCLVATAAAAAPVVDIFSRISTLNKPQRVFAYVHCFIHNLRKGAKTQPDNEMLRGPLTIAELENSLKICVKLAQQQYLHQEIRLLERRSYVPSLRALAPFVDMSGLVRVGGRLSNAPLSYHTKHPLLIPKQSHLAKLICEYYHPITLHGGPSLMCMLIQERFWIPGVGQLLRSCLFKCVICYRFKVKTVQPTMADLPPSRFAQVRAFLHVGIDYAGPFQVREAKLRKARTFKGYVCLFVCLSTKAVHLEYATEITTNAFLAALDRFIARRGLCSKILSDNGTNFVGAANHIREITDFLHASNSAITDHLAHHQVQWSFSPPAAPHFGGLWEAGVKSMKRHLLRSAGNHTFTLEEFSTLLCRIEAVLNSRPLCAVPTSVNDNVCYLTPGHFLIGCPLLSLPEKPILDVPQTRLNRWQFIQQTLQCFWKRWRASYLPLLMPRTKWTKPDAGIKVGDVVLLKTPDPAPLSWPLARVEGLVLDAQGVSRTAKVKLQGSSLTRPVNSLIKLPIEEEGSHGEPQTHTAPY